MEYSTYSIHQIKNHLNKALVDSQQDTDLIKEDIQYLSKIKEFFTNCMKVYDNTNKVYKSYTTVRLASIMKTIDYVPKHLNEKN